MVVQLDQQRHLTRRNVPAVPKHALDGDRPLIQEAAEHRRAVAPFTQHSVRHSDAANDGMGHTIDEPCGQRRRAWGDDGVGSSGQLC